jgi:hypothetical protein
MVCYLGNIFLVKPTSAILIYGKHFIKTWQIIRLVLISTEKKSRNTQIGRGLSNRYRGSYIIPVNPNAVREEVQPITTTLVSPVAAAQERAVSEYEFNPKIKWFVILEIFFPSSDDNTTRKLIMCLNKNVNYSIFISFLWYFSVLRS